MVHSVVGRSIAEMSRSLQRAVDGLFHLVALHEGESEVAVESLAVGDGGEIKA